MGLADQHCVPCEGSVEPIAADEAAFRLGDAGLNDWRLDGQAIVRDATLPSFMAAVQLIDRIAVVAEAEGHHPDLLLHGYKQLRITLSTHAIGGLSDNDFILAAKIDRLVAA